MPKLYCMCKITGDVPPQARDTQGFGPVDNQVFLAPNRFAPVTSEESEDLHRPVVLQEEMVCLKSGVHQRISMESIPNPWAKTKEEAKIDLEKLRETIGITPNVDLYRCPICGAMICVEE